MLWDACDKPRANFRKGDTSALKTGVAQNPDVDMGSEQFP
jgi:hypothetical protein